MEFSVSLDDVGSQPCAFLFIAVLSSGTATYHTVEILVDGELIAVLVDQLLHGVADVDLFGKDDETL